MVTTRSRSSNGRKKRASASKEKDGSGAKRQLSVIVPTYNETENLRPLCERLFAALGSEEIEGELTFVDDESEGTKESEKIVAKLKKEGFPVSILVRRRGAGRGLSSAVVLGFDNAKYGTLLCMDADLQHEPEAVPAIAEPIFSGAGDFSVGSRNVEGGKVAGWTFFRKVVSSGATLLAMPLTTCTDPMSGFFCTRRETFRRGRENLDVQGFKIGLELMVRCNCKKVIDVPITFQDREAGESKLSAKVYIYYIIQLIKLYIHAYFWLLILLVCMVIGLLAKVAGVF